ncbi:MAG: Uridine nucleosidase 1 [Geoglossum umbratile]|nr:MAG: Uridine nucleosidase 1 [Geoglossum umbratile]
MGGGIGAGFTNAPLGQVNGGGRLGNRTIWAEFNIYCDPESAQSIFSNPLLARKTTLITLDLTHLVLATPPVLDTLLRGPGAAESDTATGVAPPSTLRQLLHDLLTFFATTYAKVFDLTAGPPLHDPLAVAAIIPPSASDFGFDDRGGERFIVKVVVGNGEDAGRIMVRRTEDGEGGVRIPRAVDVASFWDCLEECVGRAEEAVKGLG